MLLKSVERKPWKNTVSLTAVSPYPRNTFMNSWFGRVRYFASLEFEER